MRIIFFLPLQMKFIKRQPRVSVSGKITDNLVQFHGNDGANLFPETCDLPDLELSPRSHLQAALLMDDFSEHTVPGGLQMFAHHFMSVLTPVYLR